MLRGRREPQVIRFLLGGSRGDKIASCRWIADHDGNDLMSHEFFCRGFAILTAAAPLCNRLAAVR